MVWKAEWVAVGISVLALAVAGGGTFYQQQQLNVAQQQWDNARGDVEAKARLSSYKDDQWRELPAGSNIPETELLAPVLLYAIVDLTNSGATPTAIKEVGVWKDTDVRLPISSYCSPEAGAEKRNIVSCKLPVKVPEFGSAKFYLPLTDRLKTDLQCNDYIRENGINVYIERIDGVTTTAQSKSTVAGAAYCPNFNPPEPKK
ncbi:hypothetical protein [Arthrobacter sp. Leaf137]|uniref:hypothetical protein n=1 Tax=Arthrobacter sp. Leaf137 TaxID=1736271 RepID=UPI0006F5E21A|nr:hypothetical protein [Arthrobacter sp. Leaf137]KQQ89462.1 hypothetical protein ASF64_17645 [Arthrobacter sp. Leaf137]